MHKITALDFTPYAAHKTEYNRMESTFQVIGELSVAAHSTIQS